MREDPLPYSRNNEELRGIMIHIAVVEDEELYRNQLTEYLHQFEAEYDQRLKITYFTDGDEIVEGYRADYDIILMDIEMRFMDGMTAAEKIREMDQKVIIMFITNATKYAIRGYQVDALDYVVKPVSYFSFSQKLLKAVGRLEKKPGHSVTISVPNGKVKIDTTDIYYIESEGHNLNYHTKDGIYSQRQKMADAEAELSEYGFFRSNKGYLLNMNYVDGIKDGCALVNGEELLISRARKGDFMAALAKFMQ